MASLKKTLPLPGPILAYESRTCRPQGGNNEHQRSFAAELKRGNTTA
jgi:hypothetical protein